MNAKGIHSMCNTCLLSLKQLKREKKGYTYVNKSQ